MSQYPPTSGSASTAGAPAASWANSLPAQGQQGQWQPQQPQQPYQGQPQYPGQHQQQQPPAAYGQPYAPKQQFPGGQPSPQPYGQPAYGSPNPGQQHTPSPFGAPGQYGQGAPQGQLPPGQMPPGQMPPGQMPPQGQQPGAPGAPGQAPYGAAPHGARPSGLFGQVNHAVASSKPLLQNLGNKFNKKFGSLGMPSGPTGQPAYGQPVPYGQAPPGQHPQQGYGQPMPGQAPPAYGQAPAPGGQAPTAQAASQQPGQQPGQQSGQQPINQSPQPQQTGPYGQMPPVSSPPGPGHPTDPLAQSMGKLALGGAAGAAVATAAAGTPPPVGPSPYSTPGPSATTTPAAAAPGKKWTFVDPVTEQPTPEFRAIATLMFEALNGKGSREGFVDASKILDSWKANGLEEQWVEIFAYDNYSSFAIMWSLSQIPHVLAPKSSPGSSAPDLQPTVASFEASGPAPTVGHAPATIPAKPPTEDSPVPSYIPALTVGSYVNSLFLDFFDDPASLPDLVRKQCGDLYSSNPSARGLPDLALYDPKVPAELQKRATAVRAAAVELAMLRIAKLKAEAAAATATAAGGAAAGGSGGMTPQQYQLKMQSLQAMQATNNMLNQTMSHAGHSFNAGASTGVWMQPKF